MQHNAMTRDIAILNDEFRADLHTHAQGQIDFSPGILRVLEPMTTPTFFLEHGKLIDIVAEHNFGGITPPRDAKRDFGVFEWQGGRCCWKIDYFDPERRGRSRNPANPDVTLRVLTIMLLEEA